MSFNTFNNLRVNRWIKITEILKIVSILYYSNYLLCPQASSTMLWQCLDMTPMTMMPQWWQWQIKITKIVNIMLVIHY